MPTDKQMLDWLEEQNNKARYSGWCICRLSSMGRGWRLHETDPEHSGAVTSVRQAVANAMEDGEQW